MYSNLIKEHKKKEKHWQHYLQYEGLISTSFSHRHIQYSEEARE